MLDQVDPNEEVAVDGPLRAFLDRSPGWISISSVNPAGVLFSATVSRAGGLQSRSYELLAREGKSGFIEILERPDGDRLLPSSCPQRHINANGTFCLGFGESSFKDFAAVDLCWKRLELFLRSQETASISGRWPPGAEISHGQPAAEAQLQAERIAQEIGQVDALAAAIQRNEGWIARALRAVDRHGKNRLINGRAACLCGRSYRDGKQKLRRQCSSEGSGCLVLLEAARRASEKEFWSLYKKSKAQCCGTMRDCPLR